MRWPKKAARDGRFRAQLLYAVRGVMGGEVRYRRSENFREKFPNFDEVFDGKKARLIPDRHISGMLNLYLPFKNPGKIPPAAQDIYDAFCSNGAYDHYLTGIEYDGREWMIGDGDDTFAAHITPYGITTWVRTFDD